MMRVGHLEGYWEVTLQLPLRLSDHHLARIHGHHLPNAGDRTSHGTRDGSVPAPHLQDALIPLGVDPSQGVGEVLRRVVGPRSVEERDIVIGPLALVHVPPSPPVVSRHPVRCLQQNRDPCPYCENFAGRYAWHGPPAIVAEDDTTYVFLAPASPGGMEGHTLVTTRRHVETIFDLTPEEEVAIGHAVARAARAVRAAFDPDGVLIQQHNGVAAFQTVPHFHVHVIPKRGDAPFPPMEEIPVTPAEERIEIARELRARWLRV